jgi:hypothetical protein
MNKLLAFCLAMVFSLSFAVVYADAPAYSLGTMQPINTYISSPGKNVSLVFYIFNAYGNRVSHITLSVADNPSNLEIELPPLQTNTWNISGILTPIEEHLYVEPMPIVEEKPATSPEGIFYLRSTNVSGYIPAKRVQVVVKIPENAELGSSYKLSINALANWYGELGTSQMSQSRPFSYTILVAAENYSESLYIPPKESGQGWSFGLSNEMIFGIVIAVLVIVILFQQFRPKKHR